MPDNKEETQPSTLSEAEAAEALAKAEYDAAKEEATKAKPADGTLRSTTISDVVDASEAVTAAEKAYEDAKKKVESTKVASEEAWKAEHEAAKEEVGEPKELGKLFTNKRKQERIFRREMGEPEFFLMDTGPVKSILTGDEIEEIVRKVQIPKDQTPKYNPENVLSPEFGGTTSYESGLVDMIEEVKQKLDRLLNDPKVNQQEIELAELALKKLNYLYDNYNLGMNVFRTAKGGRDTLRE